MSDLPTLEAEVQALADEQAELEERIAQDRVRLRQVDEQLVATARQAKSLASREKVLPSKVVRDNAISAPEALRERVAKERAYNSVDLLYRDRP